MLGDFSKWKFDKTHNFNGVLQQQGKLLLDSDWNAQIQIQNHWQKKTGQDAIGPEVAAVPASEPKSFAIEEAEVGKVSDNDTVILKIHPGRIWADGLHLHLPQKLAEITNNLVIRYASYLPPPFNSPPIDEPSIKKNDKDAVILEVWQEAINGYQMPDTLIETALGGPDTTERVHTSFAFRLLRISKSETCQDLKDKLKDDFSKKGKLKVTLQPTKKIDGDCPLKEGGGYTGFEHHLYRIEIAKIEPSILSSKGPMFKWSRFNGGLVGRGKIQGHKVTIENNPQAVIHSGLKSFYIEVLEFDPLPPAKEGKGHWNVIYGNEATLNDYNSLELDTTPAFYGTLPASNKSVFFRLWDGIKPISAFPLISPSSSAANELDYGILLEFEDNGKNYFPGDYWLFTVRAEGIKGIKNKEVLIGQISGTKVIGEPPHGIHYHRVPLAILTWDDQQKSDSTQIHDCRKKFRPLTDLKTCCTVTVGKGGDFATIQEAVNYLPDSTGGKICVLPGQYTENIILEGKNKLEIVGCKDRTIVQSEVKSVTSGASAPVFTIKDCQKIVIQHLDIESYDGTAILMSKDSKNGVLKNITIKQNRILALVNAIKVSEGIEIKIIENMIRMLDKDGGNVAIYLIGDNSVIEKNDIGVIPSQEIPPTVDDPDTGETIPTPLRTCCVETFEAKQYHYYINFEEIIWKIYYPLETNFKTRGGIQIGGTSEDIKIISNSINGGAGNGITLGHIPTDMESEGTGFYELLSPVAAFPSETETASQENFNTLLNDITIEGNEIRNMGLNGIGVRIFFDLKDTKLLISVENLTIYRNIIEKCLQQIPEEQDGETTKEDRFGGISLADCENLIIRENRIADNGISHLDPVCGIFVLHGENVDISDNLIVNNGPRIVDTENKAKLGTRGGIVIGLSFKKFQNNMSEMLYHDGIPSVKIHDNIVTQPFGQALYIMAYGPVSVVGNHFTSQGVDELNPYSLLAGSVFILNLGVSKDLIKYLLTLKSYVNTNLWGMAAPPVPDNTPPNILLLALMQHLPSGRILFSNNQTTLDLRTLEVDLALSSQSIITMDDVSFVGNQTECVSLLDNVITNTVIFGATVRTNSNRFQEGLTITTWSLFSSGLMNTTIGNQATHCLLTIAPSTWNKKSENSVLINTNCQTLQTLWNNRFLVF